MSAPPSFRQFQEARDRIDHPAAQDAVDNMPSGGAWREVPLDALEEEQGAWSYVRRSGKSKDASKTDRYGRTVRLGLIGVLSLASWALVLGTGHAVLAALR